MSTDPTEYGIPVIFDVTAYSREDAGQALVEILGGHRIPGNRMRLDGRGTQTVESWWTLESVDKGYDRNDNDAGVVLFTEDADYLLTLLQRTDGTIDMTDRDRHGRLLEYLHPNNRVGWDDPQEGA